MGGHDPPHGRQVLTVLRSLVEFERILILTRTFKGRARPEVPGKRLGGPFTLTEPQRRVAVARPGHSGPVVDIADINYSINATVGGDDMSRFSQRAVHRSDCCGNVGLKGIVHVIQTIGQDR